VCAARQRSFNMAGLLAKYRLLTCHLTLSKTKWFWKGSDVRCQCQKINELRRYPAQGFWKSPEATPMRTGRECNGADYNNQGLDHLTLDYAPECIIVP